MTETINSVKDKNNQIQVVSFLLDEEEFGIDIMKVREINKLSKVTQIPKAPGFVEGIVNLRGVIVPLIQLRSRLGLLKKEYDKNTRIVIVENEGRSIGFIVDSVSKVLRIDQNKSEAPPKIAAGINSDYIKSIVKLEDRLLILLELNNILSGNEKHQLNNIC